MKNVPRSTLPHPAKIILTHVKVTGWRALRDFIWCRTRDKSIIHLVNCELTPDFFSGRHLKGCVYGGALSLTSEISDAPPQSFLFSFSFSFLALDFQPTSIQPPSLTRTRQHQPSCQSGSVTERRGALLLFSCRPGEQRAVQSAAADSRRRRCQPLRSVLFNHVFSLVKPEWNLGCDMMWCMICSLRCYLSVLPWQSEDSLRILLFFRLLLPLQSRQRLSFTWRAFDCQGASNLSPILRRFCFQIFAKQMDCSIIYCFLKSVRIAVQCWKKYWWRKVVIVFLFNESVPFF